jgi:hypothetical protein
MNIYDATENAYRNGYAKGREDALSADVVEVKHARWENVGDFEEDLCFRCTNCKEEFSCEVDFRSYVKYCPECGAKMDRGRNEHG